MFMAFKRKTDRAPHLINHNQITSVSERNGEAVAYLSDGTQLNLGAPVEKVRAVFAKQGIVFPLQDAA